MLVRVSRLQVHEAILWAIFAPAGHRLNVFRRRRAPECRRRCRDGTLMLIERVVRKPTHTRAKAQSYSQSSMILSL